MSTDAKLDALTRTLTQVVATLDIHTQILTRIVEAATAEGSSELASALQVLGMRVAEMQDQLTRIEARLP